MPGQPGEQEVLASVPEAPTGTEETPPPATGQAPESRKAPDGEAAKAPETDWKAEAARLLKENEAATRRAANAEEARKRAENNIFAEQGITKAVRKQMEQLSADILEIKRELAWNKAYNQAINAGKPVDEAEAAGEKATDSFKDEAAKRVTATKQASQDEMLVEWRGREAEIARAYKGAGFDWESAPELEHARELYALAASTGNLQLQAIAQSEVARVVAVKQVAAKSAAATPARTSADRAQALSNEVGGRAAGGGGLLSYKERLKSGKELPSSEEIDRISAALLRGG